MIRPLIRKPGVIDPRQDPRAHRALSESIRMRTDSKTGSQIQGLPCSDWSAVVFRKPQTRAGQYLCRRLLIHPANRHVADVFPGSRAARSAWSARARPDQQSLNQHGVMS